MGSIDKLRAMNSFVRIVEKGSLTAAYSSATHILQWQLSYDGLSGPVTWAFLDGPDGTGAPAEIVPINLAEERNPHPGSHRLRCRLRDAGSGLGHHNARKVGAGGNSASARHRCRAGEIRSGCLRQAQPLFGGSR